MAETGLELRSPDSLGSELFLLHFSFVRPAAGFIKQSVQVHFRVLDSTIFHADSCASLKGKET